MLHWAGRIFFSQACLSDNVDKKSRGQRARDAESKVLCVKHLKLICYCNPVFLSDLLALIWLLRVLQSNKVPVNRQEILTKGSERNDHDNLEKKTH